MTHHTDENASHPTRDKNARSPSGGTTGSERPDAGGSRKNSTGHNPGGGRGKSGTDQQGGNRGSDGDE